MPAPPIAISPRATIAMVTTGGLVRRAIRSGRARPNAVRYHRTRMASLESVRPRLGGLSRRLLQPHLNKNPNYILPLSFLRKLEKAGRVRTRARAHLRPAGVSTPVAGARELGRAIAQDLKHAGWTARSSSAT